MEFECRSISTDDFKNTITVLENVQSDIFHHLFSLLSKITIPLKSGRNNRRNFEKHRSMTFGLTRARYSGIIGLSAPSKKYPEIYKEIKSLGELLSPPDFSFNSIHVNHNVVCPLHVDGKNIGNSMIVSFGDYQGGELVIGEIIYDAKCRPIIFNGSKIYHKNMPLLEGNKYSLIFFNTSMERNIVLGDICL